MFPLNLRSRQAVERWLVILFVTAAIFAVPCVYDISSSEPSPLAGLLALTGPH